MRGAGRVPGVVDPLRRRRGKSREPIRGSRRWVLTLALSLQVPRPDLSEARSLLLFAAALAVAAALGCIGLVACAGHLTAV